MTNTYNRFLLLLGFVIVRVGQGGKLLVSLVVDLSSLNGSDAAVLNVSLLRHSGGVSLGSCSALISSGPRCRIKGKVLIAQLPLGEEQILTDTRVKERRKKNGEVDDGLKKKYSREKRHSTSQAGEEIRDSGRREGKPFLNSYAGRDEIKQGM